MSIWRQLLARVRSGKSPEAEPDSGAEAPPAGSEPAQDDPLVAIHHVERGAPAALDAALSALSRARGTGLERPALDAVLSARAQHRAPDALLVAAADVFVQRGDAASALSLLGSANSSPALLLAADLYAGRGELARALTLVERVLSRDIDWPGARERHERFRRSLGAPAVVAPAVDQPTLLRAELPVTTLHIVGEAGRGGAGAVYEALDDVLGRRVALKVYHRARDERDKLEREARRAVELAGVGVVRIFDVDPARGWIVMEWLSGGALKRWLGRADPAVLWPPERWFAPLVAAVARVHEHGVVHADLKPANVLFRSPEEPVLSDFGLAHSEGERVSGGSLGYLSPERLSSEPLALDDDVYALGRILDDVLDALEGASEPPGAGLVTRWREIAALATAARSVRPADARALMELVSKAPQAGPATLA